MIRKRNNSPRALGDKEPMKQTPLRIVMISSEVESLARTGGLGDAVEALAGELAKNGADVLLVTPRYAITNVPADAHYWAEPVHVQLGERDPQNWRLGVLESERPVAHGRLRICLLEEAILFQRDGIYADRHGPFGDNDVRFAALSRGALEVAAAIWGNPGDGGGPHIVHAHDWHAALAPIYARYAMGDGWARVRTVLTIHNLAHQGVFGGDAVGRLSIPHDLFHAGAFEQMGNVNLLKGAIALCDRITTVSETYAREILTPHFGCGLDDRLRARADALTGIVNGIDDVRLNPETDSALAARYSVSDHVRGRAQCKAALVRTFNLHESERPLFGVVSRLTEQKGIDLLLDNAASIVGRGGNMILVGQGDHDLEERARAVAREFNGRVAVRVAFDPELARQVCAGVDFFVVPSRFEPCGLTQMYAMRYGAIPIVSRVGGLIDTVSPLNNESKSGTGILADAGSRESLLWACEEALSLYNDPPALEAARERGMRSDFSWGRSAKRYLELFNQLARSALTAPSD